MPRKKKDPGAAVDPRNGQRAHLAVVRVDPAERPAPPPKLRADARRLWDAYWDDALSGVVRPSELMLVRRWIANWNRYLIIMATADASPIVEGSMGQPTTHPGYSLALKLEASIRADEQQIGWGPKNRADLGLAVTEGQRSLADLNAKYGGVEGRVDDDRGDQLDDVDDDPRRSTG